MKHTIRPIRRDDLSPETCVWLTHAAIHQNDYDEARRLAALLGRGFMPEGWTYGMVEDLFGRIDEYETEYLRAHCF